jgi:glycosyltransferase involved in cell wall biosynthesis
MPQSQLFKFAPEPKGIEHVPDALPAILAQHPNVVYIILGATHPNIIACGGKSYRLKLERLAEDRGVAPHVIFYNRFVRWRN